MNKCDYCGRLIDDNEVECRFCQDQLESLADIFDTAIRCWHERKKYPNGHQIEEGYENGEMPDLGCDLGWVNNQAYGLAARSWLRCREAANDQLIRCHLCGTVILERPDPSLENEKYCTDCRPTGELLDKFYQQFKSEDNFGFTPDGLGIDFYKENLDKESIHNYGHLLTDRIKTKIMDWLEEESTLEDLKLRLIRDFAHDWGRVLLIRWAVAADEKQDEVE